MEKLFARAAALLRGEELSAAGDQDAEYLPQALDYSAGAPGRAVTRKPVIAPACSLPLAIDPIFELAAPDAPGLVSFVARNSIPLSPPFVIGEVRSSAFPAWV